MTHYEVLGVASGARTPEIRAAYLAVARRHHPDRGGDPDLMRRATQAWAVLGDPDRRAAYDREVGVGQRPTAGPAPAPQWHEAREAADLLADLEDDTPIGGTVVLPRWLALLPVALLAAAFATGVLGVLLILPALIALGFVLGAISVVFFLAAPFVALAASRHEQRRRDRR